MDDTARLGLPLVQAAQAQKHVTVNTALARLDALVPLVIRARDRTDPPDPAPDGAVWAVPVGATGAWAGQAGRLALAGAGGWDFVTPGRGWTAFIEDEGRSAIHDGTDWRAGALTLSPAGAGLIAGLREGDHQIPPGGSHSTAILIPSRAMVFGVTARVLETITGTTSAWRIGTPGALDRLGSGLGLQAGSWGQGMLGWPMAYFADTPLVISPAGGSFTGGRVRLSLHFVEITLPSA